MTNQETAVYCREQAAKQRDIAAVTKLGGTKEQALASAEAWDRLAIRAEQIVERSVGRKMDVRKRD